MCIHYTCVVCTCIILPLYYYFSSPSPSVPGTQPFFPPSSSPPKSINQPPVGPPAAATSTSNIFSNASMLTPIGTPTVSSLTSPAPPVGGVKRQLPADDTSQSVKKYKETSLSKWYMYRVYVHV